jgi:hypothetical protein
MTPQWMGQATLPILEGSNAYAQFGAELSLSESARRSVLNKDYRERLGRIAERVRIPPWSAYQKMAKRVQNPPLPPARGQVTQAGSPRVCELAANLSTVSTTCDRRSILRGPEADRNSLPN